MVKAKDKEMQIVFKFYENGQIPHRVGYKRDFDLYL